MRYIFSLLFFTLSLFGFDYHLKPYTITKGVECFFGLSTKVSEINGGNIINSCYVETDEGYIVIDSGPTYSYAQQAYKIMEEKRKIPVKYVINTSSDEVHMLGNGFYKEQGATLIGPEAYRTYETNPKTTIQEVISSDAFVNTRVTPLDTYADHDIMITVGNLDVKISKTIQDNNRLLSVHIPSRDIIFVGDMVFNNRLPALKHNRSLIKWIEALKKIEQTSWKRLISAHGIKTKHSALKNTRSYLSMLRDELQSHITQGESQEKALEKITMYSFMEDNLYNEWHRKNVAVAYDELIKLKPKVSLPAPVVSKETPKVVTKKEEEKVATKTPSNKETPKKEDIKKEDTKKEPIKKEPIKPKVSPKEPNIRYYSFSQALKKARANRKVLLIKIRSDNCPFCDELDSIMKRNNTVKKIINQNYIMVNMNNSREELPLGIKVGVTPSLAFIRPDTKKVMMITPGIEALGELISILKEGAQDGRKHGYLK
ncbi:MAG: MBL fold metallo-hydrolase [Epsilonproteobacteria bacterium]|nr:MBL fold metallo-hydrolase [Campylobacterota bacterium]